jgi:hypothetical protein
MDEAPPLPELHGGRLDADTLARLFDDLEHHAEFVEATLKPAAGRHAASEIVPLAAARAALERREVRGAQIRYRWRQEAWCDTLLVCDGGWRIVRMREGGAAG